MIIGKHSAIKGFGLFLYAIVTILALIGCCLTGGFFSYIGVLNLILNGWLIVKIYKYFSTKR